MAFATLSWLILLVVAVVLFWWCVRGRRVGDEPRCKGCEYNLTGLGSNRCPECGATLRDDLDRPLGIVHGRRKRSPVWVTVAVVVLLFSGTVFVASLSRMNINWLRFAPTVWVTSSAENGTRNAMDELVRRYKAKTLSAEQINAVISAGLKIQAAPMTHALLAQWMNLLGDIMSGGDMTIEQETSFVENSVIFTLTPRPKIRSGEQFALRVSHLGRFGNTPKLSFNLTDKEVRIGDFVYTGRGGSAGFGFVGTGGGGSNLWQVRDPVNLPPGDYEVVLTVHRKVSFGAPSSFLPLPPSYEFDDVLRAPITILPSDAEDPIKTTTDPELEPEIRDSLSVEEVKIDLTRDTHRHLDCTIGFGTTGFGTPAAHVPIDLSFRIIVKAGRFKEAIGSVWCAAGNSTSFTTGLYFDDDVEFIDDLVNAETVTVILQTDTEAARRTVDLMNVWDGEIQFDDVPLTVVKPTP